MTTVAYADLPTLVGTELGPSEWIDIAQDRVNTFADATDDHQWIHTDPERAKDGPFGGPIAHGYLTLALGPYLYPQIVDITGFSMAVNYGANKIRFPAPVMVGSKLRLGVELLEVDDIPGGVQTVMRFTFECEGATKPSCVAEIIFRSYV